MIDLNADEAREIVLKAGYPWPDGHSEWATNTKISYLLIASEAFRRGLAAAGEAESGLIDLGEIDG